MHIEQLLMSDNFKAFLELIRKEDLEDLRNHLEVCNDEKEIYRLQGEIKAVRRILELPQMLLENKKLREQAELDLEDKHYTDYLE